MSRRSPRSRVSAGLFMWPPNTRLQRTRAALPRQSHAGVSTSFCGSRRTPLSRQPLGSQSNRLAPIAFGLSLLVANFGYGTDHMSAADARRELLERQFAIVTTTQEVPEPVRVLLQALTKSTGQVLAEPGARYQDIDVVAEPGLPRRRLIFAGNGKGVYFVNYEMGGRGHSYQVAVFEWIPGRVSVVWRAVLERQFDNLTDLREAIRKGRYKDDASYGL